MIAEFLLNLSIAAGVGLAAWAGLWAVWLAIVVVEQFMDEGRNGTAFAVFTAFAIVAAAVLMTVGGAL